MVLKIFNMNAASSILNRREASIKKGSKVEDYVKKIIDDVKRYGDKSLIEYTKKFDNVLLEPKDLKVKPKEVEEAYKKLGEKNVLAIKSMKSRLEIVEREILQKANHEIQLNGIKIKFKLHSIESVGCYVPGGIASYPSTLVMAAVPAKIAGVPRVVVCTPPNSDGTVDPATLVAADLCRVDELYKVGGAQAIAAMAYGTETIKAVAKIVGPGNRYVAAAKRLVAKDTAIDMPAGPSELLILADETADPRLVALDLCSQAEHGPDSVVGLLTTSLELAQKVNLELEMMIKTVPRREIVAEALQKSGFILLCRNIDEMVKFANAFSPEHVEIMTKDSQKIADKIRTAGLVLTGTYSPAALSDYYCGTNHILPTGGFGKVFSGLSVLDFVRRTTIVSCTQEALSEAISVVKFLAEIEGLPNHYRALDGRIKNEK